MVSWSLAGLHKKQANTKMSTGNGGADNLPLLIKVIPIPKQVCEIILEKQDYAN